MMNPSRQHTAASDSLAGMSALLVRDRSGSPVRLVPMLDLQTMLPVIERPHIIDGEAKRIGAESALELPYPVSRKRLCAQMFKMRYVDSMT